MLFTGPGGPHSEVVGRGKDEGRGERDTQRGKERERGREREEVALGRSAFRRV